MNLVKRVTALMLCAAFLFSVLYGCGKDDSAAETEQQPQLEAETVESTASSFEEQDGVKLKIRTSSDYFIDGEQIDFTAVITNNTDGYIPLYSPAGSAGREGALKMSVTAGGYSLKCLQSEIGTTMPVSMSDASAPYYFLLEPGKSVTCGYVFASKALVNGEEYPLWQTVVKATLTVQVGEQLAVRQDGLDKLSYTARTVTVEVDFDGTADKP